MKVSKNARTVLWLLALLPPLTQGQEYFSDCDVDYYYASLGLEDSSSWIKSALGELLKSTHRNHLPYTHSTKEDCWDSLIDLDKGSSSSTVHLIYKDVDVSSDSHGTSDTWNREHLWPKSLGVGTDGADMTDIHHLRPADWNVNAARGNKYFGECGIVRASSECASPAHAEAAASSAKDPEIWRPPTNVRGDIARAIFYMEARYYGEGTDPDLHLSDCPTGDLDMGYLSVLLQWHIEDPVSAEEVARNNRACERWQGNRNPFVDFPSLAAQFYGSPQTPVGDGQGYPTCQSPAATSPPITGCGGLSAGGVQTVAVSSDNPDVVALVALENLSAGLVLYRTDKAWMGSEFRSYEGIEQVCNESGDVYFGLSVRLLVTVASQWCFIEHNLYLSTDDSTRWRNPRWNRLWFWRNRLGARYWNLFSQRIRGFCVDLLSRQRFAHFFGRIDFSKSLARRGCFGQYIWLTYFQLAIRFGRI